MGRTTSINHWRRRKLKKPNGNDLKINDTWVRAAKDHKDGKKWEIMNKEQVRKVLKCIKDEGNTSEWCHFVFTFSIQDGHCHFLQYCPRRETSGAANEVLESAFVKYMVSPFAHFSQSFPKLDVGALGDPHNECELLLYFNRICLSTSMLFCLRTMTIVFLSVLHGSWPHDSNP